MNLNTSTSKRPKAWNQHILCSIVARWAGVVPWHSSLTELAIVPVDTHYRQDPHVVPFHVTIKPEVTDGLGPTEIKRLNRGMDTGTAIEAFKQWFDYLGLNDNDFYNQKKIIPLAYDWPEQRAYIQAWINDAPSFGTEQDQLKLFFTDAYRDLRAFANLGADWQVHRGEYLEFIKDEYTWLMKRAGTAARRGINALEEAADLIKGYRGTLDKCRMF